MTPAVRASRALAGAAGVLRFAPPVAFVYNPLEYAWEPHRAYLERWGRGPREVLLLGMNPGPFGMAQTGVPFGEVSFVRDWLGVSGPVGRPPRECPRRPVSGFSTRRSEVSGARLWGWARARFGAPERFFERFFVLNYCPLAFMDEGGRNLTPDKLRAGERSALEAVCDEALRAMARHFRPELVVGVGKFAEAAARRALAGSACRVGSILHPSPASPAANKGWAAAAERQFAALGVRL
ncbi:MAG: single-stranded DNA-binding protein [Elusimicrobia bacterium]|nr:single-stranded DNA-binding protein [Elusimicrobiota bacterium]